MRHLVITVILICCLTAVRCVEEPAVTGPDPYIPGYAITLDAGNFDSLAAAPGLVAMIDFFSPLCLYCHAMDVVVDSCAARFEDRALVGRVNVLEEDSLASVFSIGPLPSFVFLTGGAEYERITGIVPEDSLAAALERGLNAL